MSRAIPVAADRIPDVLKARDHWVVWRHETRDNDKPTKVLYQAKRPDRHAKVNDRKTFATYEQATLAVRLSRQRRDFQPFAGVGFVFTNDDAFCGVDLDRCLTEDGRIEEWARPYVESLSRTYGEISPSGLGIKFIAVGSLRGGGKRRNGYGPDGAGAIEMYDTGRFFTITGDIWDADAPEIVDLSGPIAELYAEVQDRPRREPEPQRETRTAASRPADGRWTPEARAVAYLQKCDPAISGQGGHDQTFSVACRVGPGFDLPPDVARRLIAEVYNPSCQPPWNDRELEHKVRDAYRVETRRGWLRDAERQDGRARHKPASNGDGHQGNGDGHGSQAPPADSADRPGDQDDASIDAKPTERPPQTGAQIILDYFRERYRPVFRRGHSVACQDGELVPMGVAYATCTSELIARLEAATDAPLTQQGAINRSRLPGFFRTWASVAWGDLLASLPDEDTAELGADAPAREEFRRLVREALLSEVVLGDIIGNSGVTQIERRSLIDWCQRFAKTGPWRSIRSKKCWCKLRDLGDGEVELAVAIRHELFAQIGADRRLRDMSPNTFARRAQRYGVGTTRREDRPHGLSAITLDSELVRDLLANTPEGEDVADEEGGAS